MLTGAKAGFDVFFDMPNCNPPLTDRATIEKRILLGQKVEQELKTQGFDVHYHVYCGITEDSNQIRKMVRAYNDLFPEVCGMKMFASQSTGNMGIIDPEAQEAVYRILAEENYRGVIAVHCEKESLFRPEEPTHSKKTPARERTELGHGSDSFCRGNRFQRNFAHCPHQHGRCSESCQGSKEKKHSQNHLRSHPAPHSPEHRE